MEYKVPQGTRDSTPAEEFMMQKLIWNCDDVLRTCDAQRIDTPVFELTNVLLEKYGDDSDVQVFHIQTHINVNETAETKLLEPEKYSLRYDLTVPWSRYVKSNGVGNMRRFQIGKVYRHDQPYMKNRRFREFTQCDFDKLGNGDKDIDNAECVSIAIRLLNSFDLMYPYVIKINSRPALKALFNYCDINLELFETVCSSIDKLDKQSWQKVSKELEEKGVSVDSISKLKETFDSVTGIKVTELRQKAGFLDEICLVEFERFFEYLQIFTSGFNVSVNNVANVENVVELDFSLARGLNYYTGIIFEVTLKTTKLQIGSIAGGGRYDNLCNGIPCVGFSIGLDRVIAVTKPIQKRQRAISVWIVTPDTIEAEEPESLDNDSKATPDDILKYRMRLLTELRNKGISCGTNMTANSIQVKKEMAYALKNEIQYIAFVGKREYLESTVSIKNLDTKVQSEISFGDVAQLCKLGII